ISAVHMAHTLMEQKVKEIAEREADNKKRKWENFQGGSMLALLYSEAGVIHANWISFGYYITSRGHICQIEQTMSNPLFFDQLRPPKSEPLCSYGFFVLLLLFRDGSRSYHFKELRCSAQCLTQLRIFHRLRIFKCLHHSSSFDQCNVKSKSGDDASFLGGSLNRFWCYNVDFVKGLICVARLECFLNEKGGNVVTNSRVTPS
nr:hypothetical protein [Tanacetum cinerariifolium]